MGDIQESCSRVQEGPDLITDAEQGEGGPNRRILAGKRMTHWVLVVFSILALLVGQAAATLLSRYYFAYGGDSRWISTLLQSVGWPILLIPLVLYQGKQASKLTPLTPKLVLIYVALGLLLAGDNLLYSWGVSFMPVSTFSLLCSSQLAFNTIFAFILIRQKITPYIMNSLVLLTLSAILLGVDTDSDRPEGVNTVKYIIGFICTIAASAIYGLLLPLTQLVFDRVIKKETFAVVLEMLIYTSLVATVVCTVGLFVSGEFRDMKEEAHSFTRGRVAYYMTLIWSAIGWQVCSVGVVGLIFLVSSLFSNVTDHLDRLPDSLLLLIFNKLDDIKALGRCCAVCKRFNTLVPQVDNVIVKVDCVISGEESGLNIKGRGIFGHLMKFVLGSIVKPLQALQQFLGHKRAILEEISHHSPGEVLRNFKEIKHLRIELPGGELGIEDGVLLKWKAEFGTTLESCVILGASSLAKKGKKSNPRLNNSEAERVVDGENLVSGEDGNGNNGNGGSGSIPEPFYTNGGLKLRVVWTISSLIAASARHYLLQQIICDHPSLESLVLTDCDGQGMLCMGKQQLCEFREKPLVTSAGSNRTQVPALNMKLWYAQSLELPGGMRMEGATLVAIRPSDRPMVKKDTDAFIAGAFEEPFKTAAKALAKGKTYLLEMNSF